MAACHKSYTLLEEPLLAEGQLTAPSLSFLYPSPEKVLPSQGISELSNALVKPSPKIKLLICCQVAGLFLGSQNSLALSSLRNGICAGTLLANPDWRRSEERRV